MSGNRPILLAALVTAAVVAAGSHFLSPWPQTAWTAIVVFAATSWVNAKLLDKLDAKRSEQERSASEAQALLQTIVHNSPAVIYAKTLQGKYLLVNSRANARSVCNTPSARISSKWRWTR